MGAFLPSPGVITTNLPPPRAWQHPAAREGNASCPVYVPAKDAWVKGR
nr:MAG TPA: hypothetical protein [Caudoviricetes sp.]